MRKYIDIPMLRDHIGDQASAAGLRRQEDLSWTDEELLSCLEAAARSYNSLPPFVDKRTDATRLNADTDMFLDAATATAMERKVRQLSVERTSFVAGGVQTDPDAARIEGMSKLAAGLREKFRMEATAHKAQLNQNACYGRW